ncbi:MAG: N-acetylmuramic acid 6-phosphate etherase, partial [Anaerolineae bacterium]|nr:N-acetylmuramic acid 6-phosphate etherase [Anaerolineae bacterium]
VQGILAGGEQALTRSIEGAEDNAEDGKRDLESAGLTAQDAVVGIAASGYTPYVLGALRYANAIGALTIGVACNAPSDVLELAHIKIGVPVGPEIITGSTRLKSGTAQKLVLNMLSTGTMVRLGKVYGNLMVDVKVVNRKLAERARRIVSKITGVTHEEAGRLLDQTGNEVKTAVVVHVRQVTPDEARSLLAAAQGRLRDVIG